MEERKIIAYGDYFDEFLSKLNKAEIQKVYYILDMLKTQHRVSEKFVKHVQDGIYEMRIEANGNIYRLFFIFDDGNIVVLFHGFQKKTQKTPAKEIEKALKLKKEYYERKEEDL